MNSTRAIREANKALDGGPRKIVKFLMIPIRLARALRDLAADWATRRI